MIMYIEVNVDIHDIICGLVHDFHPTLGWLNPIIYKHLPTHLPCTVYSTV